MVHVLALAQKMLNLDLFRPHNLLVIAAVVLLWMLLLSKAKSAMDRGALTAST